MDGKMKCKTQMKKQSTDKKRLLQNILADIEKEFDEIKLGEAMEMVKFMRTEPSEEEVDKYRDKQIHHLFKKTTEKILPYKMVVIEMKKSGRLGDEDNKELNIKIAEMIDKLFASFKLRFPKIV